MKRLSKVYCQIRWDSDLTDTGDGYVFLSREDGTIRGIEEPVFITPLEDTIEVRVGKSTRMTAIVPRTAWDLLAKDDCPEIIQR